MLCTWSWLSSWGDFLGEYQSDTEDLKAFMRRYAQFTGMVMLHCKRADGRQYLWRNPRWFKNGGWVSF